MLWVIAEKRNYPHPVWATYKQWAEIGAQVRQGEKAAPVVYVGSYVKEAETADTDDETRRYLKRSAVFNVAQVDGFEVAEPERPALATRLANADSFIKNTRAKIEYGADGAMYRPVSDTILCPDFDRFLNTSTATATENAYSTILHELTHWTAPEHRVNRPHDNNILSDRAFEELVAELGAAFLCAALGITPQTRPDHAHYLASWLMALKNDKKAIFRAAAQAGKAADFLRALQPVTTEAEAVAA